MRDIAERDWKKIRKIKDETLNISCSNIFDKIDKLLGEREGKEHETYLKLWKLLNKEDKDISIMFDDLKRSNAVQKLSAWKCKGVIVDEKISEFTDETQQMIELINGN